MASMNLYDVTIPVFIRSLTQMSGMLSKAASTSSASSLPTARLTPDMLPFTFQIQTLTNSAKGVAPRVAGVEAAPMSDDETTLEQLQERVKRTIEILEKVPREAFEGKEGNEVVFKAGKRELVFENGTKYCLEFAVPNFWFHTCMAYALMRQAGVDVGKQDYLGKDLFASAREVSN